MELVLKNEWLDALKSGDYKKGKGVLRDTKNNFCCLGVLCDILVKQKVLSEWELNWELNGDNYRKNCYGIIVNDSDGELYEETLSLPEVVEIQLGIEEDHSSKLANLNDFNDGWELAINYIEENL